MRRRAGASVRVSEIGREKERERERVCVCVSQAIQLGTFIKGGGGLSAMDQVWEG